MAVRTANLALGDFRDYCAAGHRWRISADGLLHFGDLPPQGNVASRLELTSTREECNKNFMGIFFGSRLGIRGATLHLPGARGSDRGASPAGGAAEGRSLPAPQR
jgi:hypothetical protein